MNIEQKRLVIAFIQGAKWWEYEKTKFTMWPSDQRDAKKAAIERLENNSLGATDEELMEAFRRASKALTGRGEF
jgi:hypothetical protein